MRARNRIIAALVIVACGCSKRPDPGPDLMIVGDSTRFRSDDPMPSSSPWFDGTRVMLVAARSETLGIVVRHRGGGAVTLTVPHAHVDAFDVAAVRVVHGSTDMYGPSLGSGTYPDELVSVATPTADPAYFAIEVAADAAPSTYSGELTVAGRKIPVELRVAPVTLPPLPISVWAEDNIRELHGNFDAPTDNERGCVAMFRRHGVLLSPPLPADAYVARHELLAGSPIVPVDLPDPPGAAVRGWIEATAGTGLVPFAIPIDEPKQADREKVRALAQTIRDAGGGPGKFLFAVTDEPRTEYGDLVDLYITLKPKLADTFMRWTYNGAPPRAGSMVVDTLTPGTRTWGWIAWRYHLPIWYVWDALYWHDRHNHRRDETGARTDARELHAHDDATSFDNGSDRGNLDGVLALPAPDGTCRSTLRLEALRRGLEDRALLDLAAACNATATADIAAKLVPSALGDAGDSPSWPNDEAEWEAARRALLAIAACPRTIR